MLSKYTKTIPKSLNILASISIITLITKVCFFNKISEPFENLNEIGIVFEGILGSIIASYIFYIIVVHIKEVRDKATIAPHVNKWVKSIINDADYQLSAFSQNANTDISLDNVTLESLKNTFSCINPASDAPMRYTSNVNANWYQYLQHYKNKTTNSIQKLITQILYIDADLTSILMKIFDCEHFSTIDIFSPKVFSNQNLESFAETFFDYLLSCKELKIYYNENLIQYG